MPRLLSKLSALPVMLAGLPALALEGKADAPVEKADPMVVVAFLVLFLGGCLGYVVYLYWSRRKDK